MTAVVEVSCRDEGENWNQEENELGWSVRDVVVSVNPLGNALRQQGRGEHGKPEARGDGHDSNPFADEEEFTGDRLRKGGGGRAVLDFVVDRAGGGDNGYRQADYKLVGEAAVAGTISNVEGHRLQKNRYALDSGNKMYMGSGVLLFDLGNWRRAGCPGMVEDVLRRKTPLRLPDQELLNHAIPQRLMKVLPTKYNYVSHAYHPRQEYHWLRQYRLYSKEECLEAIQSPVIIHYLSGWGMDRPWHEGCLSHRRDDYYRYKALSPWKDTPLFPSILELHPPKNSEEKRYLWVLMLTRKPCPYWLAWFVIVVLYNHVYLLLHQ